MHVTDACVQISIMKKDQDWYHNYSVQCVAYVLHVCMYVQTHFINTNQQTC